MDMQQVRDVAQIIANDILSHADFSWVSEDEDLEDATEEELLDIHDLVIRSRAVLPD